MRRRRIRRQRAVVRHSCAAAARPDRHAAGRNPLWTVLRQCRRVRRRIGVRTKSDIRGGGRHPARRSSAGGRVRAPRQIAAARRRHRLDGHGDHDGRRAGPLRRRIPAPDHLADRAAGGPERARRDRRRRAHRRSDRAVGRRHDEVAPRTPAPAQLCVPRVRARRDAAGAVARRGRQPGDCGAAGGRRRRPPARGGDRARGAHRRVRLVARPGRAVSRRGAEQPEARRERAPAARYPESAVLSRLRHAVPRRSHRNRSRDRDERRAQLAADLRSPVLHRRPADAASRNLGRDSRPLVARADRHDGDADLRRQRSGRGRGWRIARSLAVRTLRRRLQHAAPGARDHRRPARPRHLLDRRRRRLRCTADADRRRDAPGVQRVGQRRLPIQPPRRGFERRRADWRGSARERCRMARVRRTAAAQFAAAVDRLLRHHDSARRAGTRRRRPRRARLRRRRHASAGGARHHRPQRLRARVAGALTPHVEAACGNRNADRGRARDADAVVGFLPAARAGARAA